MTVWSTFGRRWAALPNASAAGPILKSYFDTLYVALTGNQTVAGVKTFSSNPVVSGGAIQFPATQVASADANALDDYEEGTWTPTIIFGGAGVGITYSTQQGTYTKIGRLVVARCRVTLSSKGSSTGAALIEGLPFTSAAVEHTAAVAYYNNFAGLADGIFAFVGASGTVIALNFGGAAGVTGLAETNFTNTSDIIVTAIYKV
jgi:hypothetical protein